jgi:hypothetical protein
MFTRIRPKQFLFVLLFVGFYCPRLYSFETTCTLR